MKSNYVTSLEWDQHEHESRLRKLQPIHKAAEAHYEEKKRIVEVKANELAHAKEESKTAHEEFREIHTVVSLIKQQLGEIQSELSENFG